MRSVRTPLRGCRSMMLLDQVSGHDRRAGPLPRVPQPASRRSGRGPASAGSPFATNYNTRRAKDSAGRRECRVASGELMPIRDRELVAPHQRSAAAHRVGLATRHSSLARIQRSLAASSTWYTRSALRSLSVVTLPEGQVIVTSSALSALPRPKVSGSSTEER